MQDVNGNREPDDEWYELKGSEYGKEETIQFYAVTYYRPAAKGFDTQWTDNQGKTGCVDYLGTYHPQPFYYPEWIEEDSYTLYGPRLASRTVYALSLIHIFTLYPMTHSLTTFQPELSGC